jgi:hypothetical protein
MTMTDLHSHSTRRWSIATPVNNFLISVTRSFQQWLKVHALLQDLVRLSIHMFHIRQYSYDFDEISYLVSPREGPKLI